MGTIDRYKKAGGFVQLLNLIETSPQQKREKFLELIREESPAWEEAIRKKLLTLDRIFTWSEPALAEVFSRVQMLTLANAMYGFNETQKAAATKSLSFSLKRQLEEAMGMTKPGNAEIFTAFNRILSEVREMIAHGTLKLEKVDPDLAIEDNIEEKLGKGGKRPETTSGDDLVFNVASSGSAANTSNLANGAHHNEEVEMLKKRLINLTKEVEELRRENKMMGDKLAQIKRIA